jgi:hypothetical protein
LLPELFSEIPKDLALEADKDRMGAEEAGKSVIKEYQELFD